MFERLVFKKIELWLAAILILGTAIGGILFSWGVTYTESGGKKLGLLGEWAVNIANVPQLLRQKEIKDRVFMLAAKEQRFPGHKGFEFGYAAGSRPDLGFLLLHRYDADRQMSVTELVDLNAQKIVHSWTFDPDETWANIQFESKHRDIKRDEATYRFRNIHALPLKSGDLLTKSHSSPVFSLSPCGEIKPVVVNNLYHHSMEQGADGLIWSPSHLEPAAYDSGLGDEYWDDAIVAFDTAGNIKFEKSVSVILVENGLRYLIDNGNNVGKNVDPIHLNDIEPVNEDGAFWKKGDVFLSLRHLSAIILYRPLENKVVWRHHGDWLRQHDVDILSDGVISVFDNNLVGPKVTAKVDGANRFVVYDFATDSVSEPFAAALVAHDVRTPSEGRSQLLPTGELMVEETDAGRLLVLKKDGSAVIEYVNRADEGRVFELNWSRWMSPADGAAFLTKVKSASCS